jgi:thioester reductase-like protein
MPPELSPTPNAILLTGSTGFLGQFLLRDLLLDRRNVVVVARGKRRLPALERVRSIVERWETLLSTELAMPQVIEWDIQSSPDSLTSRAMDVLRESVRTIVHAGASVRFTLDEDSNEPFRSNVEGTRNLIAVARRIGACDFHHVSTAYVSGYSTDTVREAIPQSPRFRNVYEESKHRAEQLLEANRTIFKSLTIYRPSIIVGDSKTGFAPAFHTIYLALRLASLIQNTDGYSVSGLLNSMGVSPTIEKNLVSVDWVSSAITSALKNAACWDRIYHLTNPVPQKLENIINAMLAAIACERDSWDKICGIAGNIDANDVTNVFMNSFQQYFYDDPKFDVSSLRTTQPSQLPIAMSKEQLTTMFRYAIRCRFSDADSQSLQSIRQSMLSPSDCVHEEPVTTVHVYSPKTQSWYQYSITGLLANEVIQHAQRVTEPCCTLLTEDSLNALENGLLPIKQALEESALVFLPASSSQLPTQLSRASIAKSSANSFGPTNRHFSNSHPGMQSEDDHAMDKGTNPARIPVNSENGP